MITLRRLSGRAGRGSQAGSAYLIAMMAMVVLAILGLSLGFITQTEMLVGSTERNVQRSHYLAESGVSMALARVLIQGDRRGAVFTIADSPAFSDVNPSGGLPQLYMRMQLAPVFPVADPPCNLCQVNRQSQYPEDSFYNVRNVVTVQASLGTADAGANYQQTAVISQRNLHAMVEVQPTKDNFPPVSVSSAQKAYVEVAP